VFVFAVVMGLAALGTAPAHAQVNSVDLSGQVLDPQGAAVPGATVTVKNIATSATRAAQSDSAGTYRFVGLPPGKYELSVEAKGFARLVAPELTLTVGEAAAFDAHLKIQAGAEVVTVTESTELIETQRTAVADTVDLRRITNLPINGRNYVNFTLLASQSQRDSAPSIGAAPTSGINFGGQRARSNQVSVDGADAVDNSVNGIRATVSQEAVQEFQLIISNYMPEFGRATGGVINIVTKGGSNELHGNVFGFLRHKSIQARNPFSVVVDPTTGSLIPVKQAYTRVQAGATIGGPIVKDKTFYFFSYETTRRQETGFTNIGANTFGLVPLGVPSLPLLVTPAQQAFIVPLLTSSNPSLRALARTYAAIAGSASSVALNGIDPGVVSGAGPGARFPLPVPCVANTPRPIPCSSSGGGLAPLPASFVALNTLRGNYPISEGTSLWSARLDHQWSQRNNSFVRASVSPSLVTGIQVNAQNQNFGQNAGSRTSLQQSRDLALVGQHVTSITNSLFNEARFQFARRGLHYGFSQLPGGSGPGVNITGFAFFGREPFSTVDRIERRYQWTDNLSWIKGHHTFKVGGDINLIQLRSKKTQIFELNFGSVINFGVLNATPLLPAAAVAALPPGTVIPGLSAVQSYGLGFPTSFIQGIGTSARPFDNKAFAVFIQDSWKIHPRLTLNYGVRYDIELTPLFPASTAINAAAEAALGVVEGIPHDKNNVAPRFALAWDPWGNGKTVVRAGYGLFYDHPLLAVAFNSFTAEGAKSVQLISGGAAPSALPYPTNPSVLNGATIFQGVLNDPLNLTCYLASQQRFDPKPGPGNATCPTSIFVNQSFLTAGIPVPILPFTLAVNKNFEYGYAQQANLTVERQFAKDYKFSLSYTYTHGLKLNRARDINSTDPRLLATNFRNALAAGFSPSSPLTVAAPTSNRSATAPSASNPLGSCGVQVFPTAGQPNVRPGVLGVLNSCPGALTSLNGLFLGTAAFFNFFRPSGPNPSFSSLPGIGSYATQVLLAGAAGFPTGLGVPVPLGGVDNQESSGNSVYHGLTFNFSKRFRHHFEFLSSYTWSHAIDDATDLQTLLEPQEERKPNLERSNSTFDQRHRWVVSAVLESPYKRSDEGFWRKFLADFIVAPIVEVSSGRPYTVLTGTDFRLNLGANTGRPSVGSSGVTSPFLPGVFFTLPTVCDAAAQLPPAPVPIPPAVSISPPAGCTGNLGRNRFVRPHFRQFDLRVSRKFYLAEKVNLEFITDMFNLLNRNNKADVNPLCDLSSPTGTCTAGQPTASLDPRQFQFALKINF